MIGPATIRVRDKSDPFHATTAEVVDGWVNATGAWAHPTYIAGTANFSLTGHGCYTWPRSAVREIAWRS